MEKIFLAGPSITQKEIDYVCDAVTNGWYGRANYYQERFEKAFSAYIGSRFAASLPSCTSAIHLSLLSLGIGPGDEVIIPDITWIASASPVIYVGASPVFADIDSKTWCLSVDSLKQSITPKTKAIIVVDLYGNMPEMDEIVEIAKKYSLEIIEDAAEAIGSEYKGKKAGSFGKTGVFSFHGSKVLTTGEGGMLVTNDENIYKRVLFLRDHGRPSGDKLFWNTEVGYKYKMSALQAALGLAQLERIEELVVKKRQIFKWYEKYLKDEKSITLNYEPTDIKNTFWMVTAILDKKIGIRKKRLQELLDNKSIDSRPFFYPLSSLPAFSKIVDVKEAKKDNKISYQLSPYGINLPSALNITEEKVKYVCDVLIDIIKNNIK